MNYYDKNALKLSHEHMKAHVKEGDTVIDATAGKGRDTLLLSNLVGNSGHVYAFDIQASAVESTRKNLENAGCPNNYTLIHDSHHNAAKYHLELFLRQLNTHRNRISPERKAAKPINAMKEVGIFKFKGNAAGI